MTIEQTKVEDLGRPRVGPVAALQAALDELASVPSGEPITVVTGEDGDHFYVGARVDTRRGKPHDLLEAIRRNVVRRCCEHTTRHTPRGTDGGA